MIQLDEIEKHSNDYILDINLNFNSMRELDLNFNRIKEIKRNPFQKSKNLQKLWLANIPRVK